MHKYVVPESIRARVVKLQGKPFALERIDATRTALVVVDMQNYYMGEGFPNEAPVARAIVPNVNRMAAALRAAGGRVVWIQTDSREALAKWSNHHKYKLTPERAANRIRLLSEGDEGFKLYRTLEPRPEDLYVRKIMFSAILPNSGDLDRVLRQHGIETLLIAGTKTNVCCESTARDASMMNHRVAMISDCNATSTDEEHAAALNGFQISFGDVMTVDEAVERLVPAKKQSAAAS
ncbi:MAG: isochorismatase family protein [Acidimicrobiia bacterium]